MLKAFITGRPYRPPTVETVVDYSGDEMPLSPKRKGMKDRESVHRDRRRSERDLEMRSAVSSRSSKSSRSSRSCGPEDESREEKEIRRRERRERSKFGACDFSDIG